MASPGFPVPLVGDDVSDLIDQHRDELPFSDQLPSFDPPTHTVQRGLLMRLITPKRMKENEEFMWGLADRQIDEFIDRDDWRPLFFWLLWLMAHSLDPAQWRDFIFREKSARK